VGAASTEEKNAEATAMTSEIPATLGVVLAGGLARRIGGGDKPMRVVAGRTILERIVARLAPQCAGLILNAHGDPARFESFGLPIVADSAPGFVGPLAGILAALDWAAAERPDVAWVVSAAGDCPFLPRDLVARLQAARMSENAQLAVAASGGRAHPATGLWRVALREDLRRALLVEDCRKVSLWTARYRLAAASWPTAPIDPFFNVNTSEDLAEAERLAQRDN
jgi:molybdopterin-guanine dinucleotide biosynthesis protein A